MNHVSVNKVLLSALPALALLLPTMAAADRIHIKIEGKGEWIQVLGCRGPTDSPPCATPPVS